MSDIERNVCPGQIYRHFKGKIYQIITVAINSETNENMVVYQQLYGEFKVYVRPYDMFVSEVEHNKYPNVSQKYRFELIDIEAENNTVINSNMEKETLEESDIINFNSMENSDMAVSDTESYATVQEEYSGADKRLIEFLDADTFDEKRKVLISIKDNITDRLIDDMAASIDVTVDDGNMEDRFLSLLTCINTRAKYEVNRLR